MCSNSTIEVPEKLTLCGFYVSIAQLTFTCSKPTTETVEKGVKYIQN